MILDMDTIIFENRTEIATIIKALKESKDDDNHIVKSLIEKLEIMHLYW